MQRFFFFFFFFCIQGNTRPNKLVVKFYFLHHGGITLQITPLLISTHEFQPFAGTLSRQHRRRVLPFQLEGGETVMWWFCLCQQETVCSALWSAQNWIYSPTACSAFLQFKKKKWNHANKVYTIVFVWYCFTGGFYVDCALKAWLVDRVIWPSYATIWITSCCYKICINIQWVQYERELLLQRSCL